MMRTLRSGLVALATGALLAGGLSLSTASAAPIDDEGECSPAVTGASTHPDSNQAPVAADDEATVIRGGVVLIDVLANDTDADQDKLSVLSVSDAKDGETCLLDNKIAYLSYGEAKIGYDSFTYTVGDGDRYRTARVTVRITDVRGTLPRVTRKLVVSHGKVTRRALITATNPDPGTAVEFLAGRAGSDGPSVQRHLKPGASTVVVTSQRYLEFATLAISGGDFVSVVNLGRIDTLTGKVTRYADDDFRQLPKVARLAKGL